MAAHPSRRPFGPPQDEAVGDIGARKSSNRSLFPVSRYQIAMHLTLRTAVLYPRRPAASVVPSSSKSSPQRGGGGAPTGALFCYVARARRDDRVSETRAVPLQPGRPLGAPSWRFSAGDPRCRLRQWHRSRPATCPASDPTVRWARSRTSRAAVRAAIAGRHSPLHRQDRLRRRPLRARMANLYYSFVP